MDAVLYPLRLRLRNYHERPRDDFCSSFVPQSLSFYQVHVFGWWPLSCCRSRHLWRLHGCCSATTYYLPVIIPSGPVWPSSSRTSLFSPRLVCTNLAVLRKCGDECASFFFGLSTCSWFSRYHVIISNLSGLIIVIMCFSLPVSRVVPYSFRFRL